MARKQLGIAPSAPQDSVPKSYVDSALSDYLPKAGGTMTGPIVIATAGSGAPAGALAMGALSGNLMVGTGSVYKPLLYENSSITGATKTKITYDAKGLVTAGADAAIADITGLQTALDGKQATLGFTAENVANKDTDGTLTANSDTKYASQKATKTYVDNKTSVTQIKGETPTGTINGSNTTFTLNATPASGSETLYKNGIRLKSGAGNDYTISGQTITMSTAPATGTTLLADYNTSSGTFSQGVNNFILNEVPTGLVNSSNTTYTTAQSYIGGTLQVWVNGIKQLRSTHYTETTPSSGTFSISDAPLTGDIIEVAYQHSLSSTGNADTVDGFHASSTPTASSLVPLNLTGKYALSLLDTIGSSTGDMIVNTGTGWAPSATPTMYNPRIMGNSGVPATPPAGTSMLFGVGTSNVRPAWMNSSGTSESIATETLLFNGTIGRSVTMSETYSNFKHLIVVVLWVDTYQTITIDTFAAEQQFTVVRHGLIGGAYKLQIGAGVITLSGTNISGAVSSGVYSMELNSGGAVSFKDNIGDIQIAKVTGIR